MKGDIPSFHISYGRLRFIHRLHRKFNFLTLTFFPPRIYKYVDIVPKDCMRFFCRDLIEVTAMPKVKHLVLPLPGTRTAARIMLLLPPGMVEAVDGEEEEFRFPLVVNV